MERCSDGSLETDVSSRDSLETGFLKSRSRLGLDKNVSVSVSVSELRCLGLEKYVSVSESRLTVFCLENNTIPVYSYQDQQVVTNVLCFEFDCLCLLNCFHLDHFNFQYY